MSKKEYVIFLKSKKVQLENFFNMTQEEHKRASKAWSIYLDYRKKFFEQIEEYYRVLDLLSSPEFKRLV